MLELGDRLRIEVMYFFKSDNDAERNADRFERWEGKFSELDDMKVGYS